MAAPTAGPVTTSTPLSAKRSAIALHSLERSCVCVYSASLFTYESLCRPEVNTKCPLRKAPTFCNISNTSDSFMLDFINEYNEFRKSYTLVKYDLRRLRRNILLGESLNIARGVEH